MSKSISIKGSFDTPTIDFDPKVGKLDISGRSLPPNSSDFYAPVMKSIREYLENPAENTVFNFKMDFISSSSTKIFQVLLFELDKIHQEGNNVKVNWYYKFGDDDMKELGEDLTIDTNYPFEYIAFE